MKKLFLLIGLALVGSSVRASTTTPRTGMVIPSFGDQNWDVQLRANFNLIDSSMCVQTLTNTFTANQTFQASIFMENQPIYFVDSSGGRYIALKASNTVTNTVFTLPSADGAPGNVLSTDGAGNLSFVTAGGAGSILAANNTWTGTNAFNQPLTATNGLVVVGNESVSQTLTGNAITANSYTVSTTGGSLQFLAFGTALIDPTHDILLDPQTGGRVFLVNNSTLAFSSLGGSYAGLKAPVGMSSPVVLTLPASYGTNGQSLITDGAGNLSFSNQAVAVLNQNTLQAGATFFVSSGTVQGNFSATNIFLPGIANGNCLQTGPGGQIFSAGFACGSGGGGSSVLIQNTLQSGATFFVSSGTVNGTFYVAGGPDYLYMTSANGQNATVGANGSLELDAGSAKNTVIYPGPFNGVPGPSVQTQGNLDLQGGGALYFKQTTGTPGDNWISFIASQVVTTTQFVLPNADGPSGSALTTDGNHNLSFITPSGTSIYAATATASFPFGFSASTASINGAGNGRIGLTIVGSTYTVSSSSSLPIVGNYAIWTSTNFTVGNGSPSGGGGTPGGSPNQLQYNNAGSFGGANSYVTSSSITVISSFSVTSNGAQNNTGAGFLDVYNNTGFSGKNLFVVGSQNQAGQFIVADQTPVNMTRYGADLGSLITGGTTSGSQHQIWDANSVQSTLNLWNNGEVDLQSASTGNGGLDIVFSPQQSATLRLDKSGTSVSSSMTVTAPNTSLYSFTAGTSTTGGYTIAASTSGEVAIHGTNFNDNASAGYYGEYISSACSLVSMPASNNAGDAASIILPAGDWQITVMCDFDDGTSLVSTQDLCGATTTSGNSIVGLTPGITAANSPTAPTSASDVTLSVAGLRESLAITTTFYLKMYMTYSGGTPLFTGRISAIRVR